MDPTETLTITATRVIIEAIKKIIAEIRRIISEDFIGTHFWKLKNNMYQRFLSLTVGKLRINFLESKKCRPKTYKHNSKNPSMLIIRIIQIMNTIDYPRFFYKSYLNNFIMILQNNSKTLNY